MAIDSETSQAEKAVYVVKLGEGKEARYAICWRTTTVGPEYLVPGTGQTVEQLVKDQGLQAAAFEDSGIDFETTMYWSQSGEHLKIKFE